MSIEDPNELNRVDEEIRRNELLERASELGAHIDEDCPTEVGEQFLDSFELFDNAPWTRHIDLLRRSGIEVEPPESLSDEDLTSRLWDVINALAATATYLSHTDHLSDRELYTQLYHDLLQEETKDLSGVEGYVCHLDMIGGGTSEDNQIWLQYYADAEERGQWSKEWPADVIPDHVDPPYDRDHILPKAPTPAGVEWTEEDDAETFDDDDIFDEFREVNLRPIGDERPSLGESNSSRQSKCEDRHEDDSFDDDDIPN